MTVAELISILQQMNPKAIVVQSDHFGSEDAVKKLGAGEVQPVLVTGNVDLGLVWLERALSDSMGAIPAVMIGTTVEVSAAIHASARPGPWDDFFASKPPSD
jgi:hypothetical protein